jgi:hypothetical protein
MLSSYRKSKKRNHSATYELCDCENSCDINTCENALQCRLCNPDICANYDECENKTFPKSLISELIVGEELHQGMGLKTSSMLTIKRDSFIGLYKGKYISSTDVCHDIHYDKRYLASCEPTGQILIDANVNGNNLKYMNHSCKPNVRGVYFEDENSLPVIAMFALSKEIQPNTFLHWNYLDKHEPLFSCFCISCSKKTTSSLK